MTRPKNTCLAILTILLLPMAANADLIDVGGSTIDTSSGLEWLDMDITAGNSILDTEASAYFGPYRWATESEILGLFEYVYSPRVAGDYVDRYNAAEWILASELIDLLGPTGDFFGLYIEGVSREVVLSPPSDGEFQLFGRGYMWAVEDELNWNSESPSSACCFYASDFRPAIGSWLVREVPEPGTLALFCLGLAGMGLSGKRRKV